MRGVKYLISEISALDIISSSKEKMESIRFILIQLRFQRNIW